mgnify:CR=1 FL=1|tara:strand:+ start:381 stop:608 length:228 start_codon:yes stop_codon:yes gene_type:complete
MDFQMFNEGLKLIEEASTILESISNRPGITPLQFLTALDSNGILGTERREVLLEAATTIELSLASVDSDTHPTIH